MGALSCMHVYVLVSVHAFVYSVVCARILDMQ